MNAVQFDIIYPESGRRNWRSRASETVRSLRYHSSTESYVDRFQRLADNWERQTIMLSNAQDMMAEENFQKIVLMGRKALPLIIDRIKRKPNFLFLAAMQISGENPATRGHAGSVEHICDAWIRWAERTGNDAD